MAQHCPAGQTAAARQPPRSSSPIRVNLIGPSLSGLDISFELMFRKSIRRPTFQATLPD